MILAVASGKGGTGKTTVSVNIARAIDIPVQLLDCDVEDPNTNLFLEIERTYEETVSIMIPEVDDSLCNGCGECGRFCEYNAIVSFGSTAIVFDDMCHGCGGCKKVCPTGAIREIEKRIGIIETSQAGRIRLIQGRLDVGMAMSPPVIRRAKAHLRDDMPAILDAPPGTSCPVVTTVLGADYVILVTEPTPFGLSDLKLSVSMIKELGVPFGVVINRIGIGDTRTHDFCRDSGIPILLEIPDDQRIAEVYSRGKLIVEQIPEYRALFISLYRRLESQNN